MMKFFIAETPTGKPKIVDKHGFSIATASDGTRTTKQNISDLVSRYNSFSEMYEALERAISGLELIKDDLHPSIIGVEQVILEGKQALAKARGENSQQ